MNDEKFWFEKHTECVTESYFIKEDDENHYEAIET